MRIDASLLSRNTQQANPCLTSLEQTRQPTRNNIIWNITRLYRHPKIKIQNDAIGFLAKRPDHHQAQNTHILICINVRLEIAAETRVTGRGGKGRKREPSFNSFISLFLSFSLVRSHVPCRFLFTNLSLQFQFLFVLYYVFRSLLTAVSSLHPKPFASFYRIFEEMWVLVLTGSQRWEGGENFLDVLRRGDYEKSFLGIHINTFFYVLLFGGSN